eukprot:13366015-Alexandrium_andersonii.AAC.1
MGAWRSGNQVTTRQVRAPGSEQIVRCAAAMRTCGGSARGHAPAARRQWCRERSGWAAAATGPTG